MENNLYKQFFESSPFALALVEINTGKCIKINNSFDKLFSYSKDELSNLNFWDVILKKDDIKKNKTFIENLKQSKRVPTIQKKLLFKKRKKIDFLITCFLAEDPKDLDNNFVYIQIEKDISKKLKKERAN